MIVLQVDLFKQPDGNVLITGIATPENAKTLCEQMGECEKATQRVYISPISAPNAQVTEATRRLLDDAMITYRTGRSSPRTIITEDVEC